MRKQAKFIKKMEENNKIPDKLMPKKIKDMLDEAGFAKPIITDGDAPEIRLNGGRTNALRCLAVVAVFVLVVGGFAFLKLNGDNQVKEYPDAPKSQSADTSQLDGLRGTTYKGIFNFLKKNKNNKEVLIVDNRYIYENMFDEFVDDYITNSYQSQYKSALTANQIVCNPNELNITQEGVNVTPQNYYDESSTFLNSGDVYFYVSEKGLTAYRMKNGKIETLKNDFFEDTFLKKELVDIEKFQKFGCKFMPSVTAMYLDGNELNVFFDFYLPTDHDDHSIDVDYCGMCSFDISDPENIRLISEYEQPGTLEAIRKVNGKYFIMSRYTEASQFIDSDSRFDEENLDFIPARYINGDKQLFEEQEMYIAALERTPSLILLSSFDGENQCSYMTSKLIACGQSKVCMGTDNIYLIRDMSDFSENANSMKTLIIKISYGDGELELTKSNTVAVSLLNSYTVQGEEYNGNLTVFSRLYCTYPDEDNESTDGIGTGISGRIMVFDPELELIGDKSVEYDIADETVNISGAVYHNRIYVFDNYLYLTEKETYSDENPIQFRTAYDLSDPENIVETALKDVVATQSDNADFIGDTQISTATAADPKTNKYQCELRLRDKTKTQTLKTYYISGENNEITLYTPTYSDISKYVMCKCNSENYKDEKSGYDVNSTTYIDGGEYGENKYLIDKENGIVGVIILTSKEYGGWTSVEGEDWEQFDPEYAVNTTELLLMKYDREKRTFSDLGSAKLFESTSYYQSYYDNHQAEEDIDAVYEGEEYYKRSFAKDGYIYVITNKRIISYSYDDLSKAAGEIIFTKTDE